MYESMTVGLSCLRYICLPPGVPWRRRFFPFSFSPQLRPSRGAGWFIYSQYVPPKAPRTLTNPRDSMTDSRAFRFLFACFRLAAVSMSMQSLHRLSPSPVEISFEQISQNFIFNPPSVAPPWG